MRTWLRKSSGLSYGAAAASRLGSTMLDGVALLLQLDGNESDGDA